MTSLTHKFLLGVGLMTIAVTAFAAVAGFVVFQQQLQARELRYLQDYVSERVANEERRFSDLTSLHRAAADALALRIAHMTPADATRRFERDFPLRPDGSRRTPDAAFDGMFESDGDLVHGMGGFIARGRPVSAADKAMFAAAFQVVAHTGEIVHREYSNFYFFTPDNRMVMFGPDRPDKLLFYRRDAPADLDIRHEQMVEITTPAANPDRRTRCTSLQRLLQNTHGERLATACVTPVDLNGRHVGAFGSSIVLTGYFMQAIGRAMPGASNLIVSSQGDLIAYPGFATPGRASEATIARYQHELHLKTLIAEVARSGRRTGAVISPDGKQIVAFGLLSGPDWYFLVTYPRAAVASSAAQSASWILIIGLLAAIAETALVVFMARKTIAIPLNQLVESAEADPQGRKAIVGEAALERRTDEIGLLARTLRTSRERVEEVLGSLEQRVSERTAELELANQEKSRFLANMSHELRTPLNGVVAVSEVLAREQKTIRTREMAELIVSSGRLLERVLSDILDFSKIEAGQMRLELAPFDLGQLTAGIAGLHRASAHAKGLDFRWSVAPAAEGVYRGDAVRLTQVLSNLLSNAVKFTETGAVELAVDRSVNGLSFKVRDSGIGFDEEARRKLFRRFEQADASITRRFGGTGLGLAICRSLVEMMDGEIIVTSEPGQGSTFEVAVPMERVGDVQPVAPDAKPARELVSNNVRILLAEDHPANQRVVQLLLEPLGVDLTIVEDGQAALDRLANESFDVVLMDMQMPVMDGLTATTALRVREAAAGAARTPVIMLTANALDDHVKASVDAGADRHLSKPIRADALIGAISEVIAEREAALAEEVA